MKAIAKDQQRCRNVSDQQKRLIKSRDREATCGDTIADSPDRLVFVVSLILLPFMLII